MKTVEMPKMGDTMEEGKILHWIKREGDEVKKGESLAEVETDKVNIEIEAFSSGILRKIVIAEGESAPIGAPIAYIGAADEPLPGEANGGTGKSANGKARKTQEKPAAAPAAPAPSAVAAPQAAPALVLPGAESTGRVFISPLARRLAEEHNLDYRQIRGTGPNGRIIKLDVEAALQQAAPAAVPFTLEPQPASIDAGEVVEIPLTAMRRTIAKRLTQSMQSAPHFYVTGQGEL
jgi:pyruvate dehydrogenase E2 component (dihydrolipoamide acetyltransferase)